ncbi:MFS transporter [Microbacterium lushaniae]|nr:MFS transporter [Microbacterium lushaniae]
MRRASWLQVAVDCRGGAEIGAALSLPLIAGVFTLFAADAMFQIALPTVLVAGAGMTGAQAGTMLAIGMGVGILLAAPVADWSDRHGRRKVVAIGGLTMLCATVLMVTAGVGSSSIALWLIAVTIFGLARTPTTVVLLAYVTEHGDKLRMQSFNSVSQRGAVGVAAGVVALLTALSAVWAVFIAMLLFLVAMVLTTPRMPDRRVAAPPRTKRTSTWRALAMLRERPIVASSALNTGMVMVVLLGNAFYPLGLVGLPPAEVGLWVLVFLVTRDAVSVCAGLSFRRLILRLGMRASLIVIGCCSVAGLALLAFAPAVPLMAIPAAMLQGVANGLGIGCTNLLATSGATSTEGRALRITATQYFSAAGALITPIVFGALFDVSGVGIVFGIAALLCAVLMTVAVQQAWAVTVRPHAGAPAADETQRRA